MSKKRTLMIHPFIFAVYPILFFFNLNKRDLWFSETLAPMAASLIAALFLLVFFKIVFKETMKAGILVSLILILFYSYEAIQTGITGNDLGDLVISLDSNLFWSYGIIIALFASGLYFLDGENHRITEFLNVMSVVLVTFSLYGFVSHKISSPGGNLFPPTKSDQNAIPEDFKYTGPKPDIYYIILDGYLRDDVMNKYWEFDNSEFIQSLTKRGFYVAPKSRSNYTTTGFSLSSSLNMKYILVDLEVDTSEHLNNTPMIEAVGENRVVNFLKSIGYLYVHLSDDAADSKKGNHVDISITNRKYSSLFSQYLLNKTILKNLKLNSLDVIQTKRNNILYGFKKLEEISKIDEPTFTFAHFLMPHVPQAFDKNGDIPVEGKSDVEKYFDEVLYANKRITLLVNHILEKSETPPIILVQGDHGYLAEQSTLLNEEQAIKYYSNLSAYHLPGNGKDQLYETITPVNSFRLIFDHYFRTQFGLLEDTTYFPVSYDGKRKFISAPNEDSLNSPSAWVESAERTLLKNPDFAEVYAFLGESYANKGRFQEATSYMERLVRLKPGSAWAYVIAAKVYLESGKNSMALDTIQQAILLNPGIAEPYTVLGDIKANSGSYQEAIKAYDKALNINPNLLSGIHGIGKAYLFLNDKEKSILYFNKAVLTSPSYSTYNNLGAAYGHFGLIEEAILSLKKALEINPNIFQANFNLGNTYLNKKNNPVEAAKYYQKALVSESGNVKTRFALGSAYLKSNQIEAARLEFQKILKLNPGYIPAYINLGYSQLLLGQKNQARATYEAALLKKSDNPEIHKSLGSIYSMNNENPDRAIFHLQESIRLAPSQPEAAQIHTMIEGLKRQGQKSG